MSDHKNVSLADVELSVNIEEIDDIFKEYSSQDLNILVDNIDNMEPVKIDIDENDLHQPAQSTNNETSSENHGNLPNFEKPRRGRKPNPKKTLHPCSICNKEFGLLCHLKIHYRTHTNEKPYKCSVCSKDFAQRSNLWKHVKTHTGERPHECMVCNRKFAQKSNLRKHVLIHSGEKPYVCETCGMSFSQSSNLRKHVEIHKGVGRFVCNYCNKKFNQKVNLKNHLYVHEGVKPFRCTLCSMSFRQKTHLERHRDLHNGDKVYHCVNNCGRLFLRKAMLVTHLKDCKTSSVQVGQSFSQKASSVNEKKGCNVSSVQVDAEQPRTEAFPKVVNVVDPEGRIIAVFPIIAVTTQFVEVRSMEMMTTNGA